MTDQIIIRGAVLIRVALRDHPTIAVERVNLSKNTKNWNGLSVSQLTVKDRIP